MPRSKKAPLERRPTIDVLIVCALEVEFHSLEEEFLGKAAPPPDLRWIAVQHFHARVGELNVLVVRLPFPEAGNVTSAAVTANLLPILNPWLVISFGIAGTLKKDEVPAGHVVFAKTVYYVDLRKDIEEESQITKSTPAVQTPPDLLYRLQAMKTADVHDVVLVSSEAVVKAENSRVRKFVKHVIGDASVIEMEAFGVYQACDLARSLHDVRKRYWVAIKGISDSADITKDDVMHRPAAKRAGGFVHEVLCRPEIVDLRRTATAYTEPLPFRPFVVHENARDVSEKFFATAADVLADSRVSEALHAALLRSRRPRVFYHWRLTGMGLHWVELRFLRVLRQLAALGYPVECLITDSVSNVAHNTLTANQLPEAKVLVARMLRGLLKNTEHHVTFLGDVKSQEKVLDSFGTASGDHQAFLEKLVAGDPQDNAASDPTLNVEFNLWLRYIAWRSRGDGTCVALHHPLREWIYSLLWYFGDLVPALLRTPYLTLGGEQGKFSGVGKALYLVPPKYEAIVSWMNATTDRDLLKEFWEHITETVRPGNEFIAKRQQAVPRLDRMLARIGPDRTAINAFLSGDRNTADFYRGAITVELAHWTRIFGWNGRTEE